MPVLNSIDKICYRLVLTGGPCGGKTTGQARLCSFFENLGWKVYRVPETASILLGGGINSSEFLEEEAEHFQENLLKSMLQIENTFFKLAEQCSTNCLVICDRGAMDASAFINKESWERILQRNNWNNVDLRDNRYNQVIHMASAANGAEEYYSLENNHCRSENIELAQYLDIKASAAWIGHPYFDVIDNSTDFEGKIRRLITSICIKIGIGTGDRLMKNAKKRKFLIRGPLPENSAFPTYQDFEVVHNYLQCKSPNQIRLRKRGQQGYYSYVHTLRKENKGGQTIEVKTQISHRDYTNFLGQKDNEHYTVYKTRRCFVENNQYYQLDIYKEPCHPRCFGLIILETYSTLDRKSLLNSLPIFLNIECEVTDNPNYSMYNLSIKKEWQKSKKLCRTKKDSATIQDNNNYYNQNRMLSSINANCKKQIFKPFKQSVLICKSNA